ncbi:MAG: DUF11 domain-containing protein, partial [Acidimicrobiia bacterium]
FSYDSQAGFSVASSDAVVCTFTNTRQTGTIRVNKVWSGGASGELPTVDLNIGTTGSGHQVNQTGVTGLGNGTTGAQTVVTGSPYFVSESALAAGWAAGSAVCTKNGTPFSYDSQAGFSVASSDAVVCTFTNAKQGSITITKVAVPQDAQNFTFATTNLGGSFTLDDDTDNALSNVKTFPGLAPGTTYTVTENPVTGWKLTALDCTGLGQGDSATLATGVTSIALKPGQDVSCTYTNTSPDLGVEKSDDPDPVVAGNQLTYTVTVTNHGPADATGVVVTDTLDPNTTFVSTSLGADCQHAAGVVTCQIGNLASAAFVNFTITVTVLPGAPVGTDTLDNHVEVSGDQPDWNPDNNTDDELTSVISVVDLAVVKTADVASVIPGQSFTYTLSVRNLGPSDAQVDATVIDVLPTDITFVSFHPLAAGVSCSPPVGQQLTCTILKGLLGAGDPPVLIRINVTMAGTPSGQPVTNKTVVTSPDDEAPCVVTPTDITCNPANTNNYSEVQTPVVVSEVIVTPPPPPPAKVTALAFTGTNSLLGGLVGFVALLLGVLLVMVTRRGRRGLAL